jgi:hypothetical protein
MIERSPGESKLHNSLWPRNSPRRNVLGHSRWDHVRRNFQGPPVVAADASTSASPATHHPTPRRRCPVGNPLIAIGGRKVVGCVECPAKFPRGRAFGRLVGPVSTGPGADRDSRAPNLVRSVASLNDKAVERLYRSARAFGSRTRLGPHLPHAARVLRGVGSGLAHFGELRPACTRSPTYPSLC